MPPWHADPAIGEFMHDMSLSVEQKQQLLSWIDAGSPRGAGDDPLTAVDAQLTEWSMGEPDYIITLPEFDIPATGSLDYQFFEVPNTLDRDVWVKAVQIAPGDRQVVHHAIATFGSVPGGMGNSSSSLFQPQLMTFVPGNDTYVYPEDTGVFVPAGTSFYTQMHYTTYGRETRDQTKIGLYFADEAPHHVLQHYSIINQDLNIPAGEAEHEESSYYAFQRDAVIYSLFPHAHYRGRSSEFALRYPDGREEVVLSVPNYDFNWQRYFQFQQPIAVPAGTLVIHRTTYDNSTANLSNPDPTVTVRFGEQTWEEMLYGGISFRYAEARENDFEINVPDYFTSLGMGMFDKNMDGRVSLDEMPEQARQQLALVFAMMDKDKTGGLEFAEFQQFMIQTNMVDQL
ncbi:MAG: EF-hand domain-containing protein, partial [Pseudohongiella sp.]|nr:EF-hand domain-containing protein [Pseudohongiella sp.]